jgi:hypothetical protein
MPEKKNEPVAKVNFQHFVNGESHIIFDRPEIQSTYSVYPPNYIGKIVEKLYEKRIFSTRDLEDIFELY